MKWEKIGNLAGKDGKDGADAKALDTNVIAEQVLAKVTKALDSIPAAKDGKDADPEFVRAVVRDEVSRAVAALPPPKVGKDGESVDLVKLSGEIMAAAAKAVAAIPVPKDGRDFDPEVLRAEVQRAVEALPKPKDGQNADPEPIRSALAAETREMADKMQAAMFESIKQEGSAIRRALSESLDAQVKALPPAPPGKDADPEVVLRMVRDAVGAIPPPQDGRDGPTLEEIRPMLEGEVAKAVALIPPAPPGRDGRDIQGAQGKPGEKGADGQPGRNGLDGFSPDDFDAEIKDGRTLVLSLKTGDRTVVKELRLPLMLDRGVYKSGASYEVGDGVTYGGSYWLCQKDTAGPPGGGLPDWRLAVKRGRDASPSELRP